MYAIIETGGKQYRVGDGDVIRIERLSVEAGEKIEFDKVLAISNGDGLKVGTPYVEGAKVAAEVLEHGKGDKVIIFKYLPKKDSRKKQGHRQPYSEVRVLLGGDSKNEKKEAPKSEAKDAKSEDKKEAKVSQSMKKDELIAFAKEHEIEVDEKATKAVIIETIENAMK